MTDRTREEKIAEDFVSHKLMRSGIYVAKPYFDIDAADLLALLRFELKINQGGFFKYCRIQCKYRSLSGSNSKVEIEERYMSHDLIVFLYVDEGIQSEDMLYCFFYYDIQSLTSPWSHRNGKYTLRFSDGAFRKKLKKYLFIGNEDKIAIKIKQLIETSFQVEETVHGFIECTLPAFTIQATMKDGDE